MQKQPYSLADGTRSVPATWGLQTPSKSLFSSPAKIRYDPNGIGKTMQDSAIIAFRTGFVFAVLITMPVLAIPSINTRVNALLHDEGLEDIRQPAVAALGTENIETARPHVSTADSIQWRDPQSVPNRLLQLRERLEQLGADYLLLELSPGQEVRYCFQCRMRVAHNADGIQIFDVRTFKATEADPVRAMAVVLAEVRAWRANDGRRPK